MGRTRWRSLVKPFLRLSVLSVFVIVALWNTLIASQKLGAFLDQPDPGPIRLMVREFRDFNLQLQLISYQMLVSRRPAWVKPQRVTLVYIDDHAHWTRYYGESPTDRCFLRDLIRKVSQPTTKAAAIGLDVELLAPRAFPAGADKNDRSRDDNDLLDAIKSAAGNGVPVILPVASATVDGLPTRLPNIFSDAMLPLQPSPAGPPIPPGSACQSAAPACVWLGYIDAPDDRREIPLTSRLYEMDKSGPYEFDSFAFAMVKAFEGSNQTTAQDPDVVKALAGRPLDGTFFKETDFTYTTSDLLLDGDPDALKKCSGRIVLIGGHWHDLQGYGPPVDSHLSSAGEISGLAFHGNYIESLLYHHFQLEVGLWVGIVVDLIVGLTVYWVFDELPARRKFLVLLAALIPPLAAYVALVNFNVYLDFLFPIELYFLHIFYELARDYVETKRSAVHQHAD